MALASPTMTVGSRAGARYSGGGVPDLFDRQLLQPLGELAEVGEANAGLGQGEQVVGQAGLRLDRQGRGADQVAAGGVELVRVHRQGGHPAQLVAGLEQGGGGHLGADVGRDGEQRAERQVLDPGAGAVGVALVLPDVLHQAGREVAAEDHVGHLQGGEAGVEAGEGGPADADVALGRAGPVDEHDRAGLDGRQGREPAAGRGAGPGTEGRLGGVEGLGRAQIADQDEQAARRRRPGT